MCAARLPSWQLSLPPLIHVRTFIPFLLSFCLWKILIILRHIFLMFWKTQRLHSLAFPLVVMLQLRRTFLPSFHLAPTPQTAATRYPLASQVCRRVTDKRELLASVPSECVHVQATVYTGIPPLYTEHSAASYLSQNPAIPPTTVIPSQVCFVRWRELPRRWSVPGQPPCGPFVSVLAS